MSGAPGRALLLFVDGLGIGGLDPEANPVVAARLPRLRGLLGGALPVAGAEPPPSAPGSLTAADATLGLPGLPQSGTGQTSLLTGVNAAALYGRHFGPWVPTGLREMLARENLLSRAAARGRSVAFANATPPHQLGSAGRQWRRPAAPPLAAQAAGAWMRDAEALRSGRAVASSITNEKWRQHLDPGLPDVEPAEAGRRLAAICAGADLSLFAHYDADLVGHRGDLAAAVAVLERLDAFVGGLLDALPADALLVIASDHGNVEEVRAEHTRNPVPVIAAGPGRLEIARRVRGIQDVAPTLLQLLGAD